MATTTPNYGWPVPTSTDLVKDGATAIEALGDAIDSTVFGLGSPGLVLVKSQVIGTTVSSVNVTSAFSTTYDNYKIVIAGGLGSTTNVMGLKLGAAATGYYSGATFTAFGAAAASARINNNAAAWLYISFFTGSSISFNVELINPFLAKNTLLNFWYNDVRAGGEGGAGSGFLNDSTSYTDFTITPAAGTLTGGTIYVYGYKK
jgi:hypothetical protein